MQFFGITLETRDEKAETLKGVIRSLDIKQEEKDLYIISIDILTDNDFSIFFNAIMSQVNFGKNSTKYYTIEPLTSQII